MFRYRTADEIRRYDLMKLGVLLLLLALLALTWIATRDVEMAGPVVDESATSAAELASVPAPTLGIPSINAPTEAIPPGSVTLSGTAGPGAQIVILVDGLPAGAAIAGGDGAWSAMVELATGDYTVQAQTVDNVGAVVGESLPIDIHVGDTAETDAEPAALATPVFDALTGEYVFSGTGMPGETITISSNGAIVGTGTVDASGNWTVLVPADAVTGEITMQAVDAAGDVSQQSEPLKLNARPPSLSIEGDMQIDPASGAILVPTAGDVTLTGQGEPGTQVEVVVDGAPATTAVVDVSRQWVASLPLSEGVHVLQLNTLDPGGTLLAAAQPVTVAVGEQALAEVTAQATNAPANTPEAATLPASTPEAATPEATSEAAPEATPVATGDQAVADLLAGRADLSNFWAAAQTVGLSDTLAGPTDFTVFAPTNDVFNQLPPRVVEGLAANPQVFDQIMQYHVARGRYSTADLLIVQPATLNGRLLTTTGQGDTLMVNDATVVEGDIAATNGFVHAIDRILVPPLAIGVRPPVIEDSGVSTFTGTFLTVVGTAEPNSTILVELNGESFGQPAVVGPDAAWAVAGDVTPGDYQIIAYMLDAAGALQAISRPVALSVR
jgi:uncharacterized surface protein with fasciclin (FAS1) repeats